MQRTIWRQFIVLMCIALAIPIAQYVSLFHTRLPHVAMSAILWAALLESPTQFYHLLPVVPAIALGVGYTTRRSARAAVAAVGLTMLIMIVVDVWITPAANRQLAELAAHPSRSSSALSAAVASPPSLIDSVGALRSMTRLLRERPSALAEHLRTYPSAHPRVIAERGVEEAAFLLLPGILVGLVIGIAVWIRARVIFRSKRDEIVARWFLAWIVAPAAFALIGSWSGRYGYDVLFRDGSLWLPLVPYAPFAILGALGWRAALSTSDVAAPELERRSSESRVVSRTPAA